MRRCDGVQFYYFGKTIILQNEKKRYLHGNTDGTFSNQQKKRGLGDLSRKIIGGGRKYFLEPLTLADRYYNFFEHAVGHKLKS